MTPRRIRTRPTVGRVAPVAPAVGTWYTEAVAWAYENGITEGISQKLFAPNVNVTRERMVTFLYGGVRGRG